MTLQEDLDKVHDNALALESVINGPETGAGATISLPLGETQKTLLATMADLVANASAASAASVASANANAAAAASTVSSITDYVYQRAVLTVQESSSEWETGSPDMNVIIGDYGIYFVNAPVEIGDYAGFTAPNQTCLGIVGGPDDQHSVTQLLVDLINGVNTDNLHGLTYAIDDFASDPLVFARYLGASGPLDAYGQLEIVYIGPSPINLSASAAVATWDVATVGVNQDNPFFFKNGETLTADQKELVRSSIFGSIDGITTETLDVLGAATVASQDMTDVDSVLTVATGTRTFFNGGNPLQSYRSVVGTTQPLEVKSEWFVSGTWNQKVFEILIDGSADVASWVVFKGAALNATDLLLAATEMSLELVDTTPVTVDDNVLATQAFIVDGIYLVAADDEWVTGSVAGQVYIKGYTNFTNLISGPPNYNVTALRFELSPISFCASNNGTFIVAGEASALSTEAGYPHYTKSAFSLSNVVTQSTTGFYLDSINSRTVSDTIRYSTEDRLGDTRIYMAAFVNRIYSTVGITTVYDIHFSAQAGTNPTVTFGKP